MKFNILISVLLILLIHFAIVLIIQNFYNEVYPKLRREPLEKKYELEIKDSFILLFIISFIFSLISSTFQPTCIKKSK